MWRRFSLNETVGEVMAVKEELVELDRTCILTYEIL